VLTYYRATLVASGKLFIAGGGALHGGFFR
jgi:hypothetical protein